VAASGAEIEWIEDKADGLADSVFTHDPSLMTDRGALILSMGKPLRAKEPSLHEETYRRLGIPVLGRVEAPGQVEGGDCVWVDARTLAIGRGVRTNQQGIQQVANLLTPLGISVYGFDLPLWQGEEACLHLMSVISPLADDLALVFAPLLPAAFYQMLRARGITLVDGDAGEFHASNGLSLNVLPTSPRQVIAVAGFPKTKAAMEAAGCAVETFEADALCIACEGGPTCLTRPILRQ
jgi:N-dimethylarginine dimethylaminohydrolase